MTTSTNPLAVENAVLTVLAGTPLGKAAAQAPMDPTDLADAVAVYQAAGRTALQAQAASHSWYQVRIRFTDWDTAEQIGARYLGPALRQTQQQGVLTGWWFIRKYPCWRLRCHPGPG